MMKKELYKAINTPDLELFIELYKNNFHLYNFIDVLSKILSAIESIEFIDVTHADTLHSMIITILKIHKYDTVHIDSKFAYKIPFETFKILVEYGLNPIPTNNIVKGFLKNNLELDHIQYLIQIKYPLNSLTNNNIIDLLESKNKHIYRLINKYIKFEMIDKKTLESFVIKQTTEDSIEFFVNYLIKNKLSDKIFSDSFIDILFHKLIYENFTDTIKILFESGIRPNSIECSTNLTHKQSDLVKIFLDNEIDIVYVLHKMFTKIS